MADLNTRNTLALRRRPRDLDGIVGQAAAVEVVRGLLERETAPNSFLVTGPSGTGKTTISRIIAAAYNCDDLSACGKCASCESMAKGAHLDYMEVNGSDCGIDRVRELLEVARYRPRSNLRVIVIDECHRLTNPGVNALLKALEEPPPATLWILATTDPDRIPNAAAVAGRCQRLELGLVPARTMAPHVLRTGRAEGMKWMDKAAAMAIAEASGGRVRDALQIAESVDARSSGGADAAKLVSDAALGISADESRLAMKALLGCYSKRPAEAADALLDVQDHRAFINRMLSINHYLIMTSLLGAKRRGIWPDRYGKGLVKGVRDRAPDTSTGAMASMHSVLERSRADAAVLSLTDARHLLTARLLGFAADQP